MAETADQIRAGIEGTRADLDRKLDLLETKARHELSLRNQFARRPWQALGVAAGFGVVLGLLFGGRDDEDEDDNRRYGRRASDRVLDTTGMTTDLAGRPNTKYPDLPL